MSRASDITNSELLTLVNGLRDEMGLLSEENARLRTENTRPQNESMNSKARIRLKDWTVRIRCPLKKNGAKLRVVRNGRSKSSIALLKSLGLAPPKKPKLNTLIPE